MKKTALLLILSIMMVSCKQNSTAVNSQQEIVAGLLKKFPMLGKDMTLVRKISLDSISITLLRNDSKVYDEVLIFEKNGKCYAIPLFSNMYSDYWNFQNNDQPTLFPATNSTFDKEFSKLVTALNITPNEFDIIINELMFSVLHAENDLESKIGILKNNRYQTYRVDKYKIEEPDKCLKRRNKIFDQISKESSTGIRRFQYFLDKSNGRIYKIENESKNGDKVKIKIQTYRIDCYSYNLDL